MGVVVMSGGMPVTLDSRLWSLNPETMAPWSATSFVGSSTLDPLTVWRTQRSVRTVVGFIARNIAQVSLHAFKTKADGDRDRLPSTGLLPRLLANPSKTTTGYGAMQSLVIDVCLWDRHASWIQGDGSSLELVRIPPWLWSFKRDRLGRPQAISMVGENRAVTDRPLSEFLWIDGFPIDGASPLDSLASLLAEEAESSAYRVQLWQGGARMPGWIKRPAEAPPWSGKDANGKTGRDKFKESWQAFSSAGARAGMTPLLEDGMEYHEVQGMTPESAQQLESRKFSIAEVSAAFYLPPVFAGLLDNSNYSNVTAFREILYSDTLGPWFQDIQQAHNARLLPHPAVQAGDDEFVEFNVAEKLRMSFDEQAKIFQTATGGPIMTRNEARRRLNLTRLDGADELIVPMNVTAGGQASPTDSAPQGG